MVEKKQKLQNITIAIPEIYADNLRKLQDIGLISSRSDGIRSAVREFLEKEINNNCQLLGYKIPDSHPN